MKHISDKKDWLTYEFKPYFFIGIALLSIVLKRNVTLTGGQNFIAFLSITVLLFTSAYIFMARSDYRRRSSRN